MKADIVQMKAMKTMRLPKKQLAKHVPTTMYLAYKYMAMW
jgi:hypothetical protein